MSLECTEGACLLIAQSAKAVLSCSHCQPSQLAVRIKAMSKRSILVVDDDKNTRDYLATCLGASSYAMECLGAGDEANEPLTSGDSSSTIVLDIMLPDKAGMELISIGKA